VTLIQLAAPEAAREGRQTGQVLAEQVHGLHPFQQLVTMLGRDRGQQLADQGVEEDAPRPGQLDFP
jgi:hypothetical protein